LMRYFFKDKSALFRSLPCTLLCRCESCHLCSVRVPSALLCTA
jgi:hypothetical protein